MILSTALCMNPQRLNIKIESLGFYKVRQKGSHKQFRHSDDRGTTVPFHAGRDISPILLKKIAKDIKLAVEGFLKNQ